MNHCNLLRSAAVIGVVMLVAGTSDATHKSWRMEDAGATCLSAGPRPNDAVQYDLGNIVNGDSVTRTVDCPVTLAGRFAASTPQFGMNESAMAREGNVRVYDSSSTDNVMCEAYVISSQLSTYYSQPHSSSGEGDIVIPMYDISQLTWGGTLGNGNFQIRAFGYRCFLPPGSAVYSYAVNICQVPGQQCHL